MRRSLGADGRALGRICGRACSARRVRALGSVNAPPVTARSRTVLEPASVPRFPRGTRFRFDATRNAWVILAPERLMMPDEIATEVLKLVDGDRTIAAIAEQLATKFNAPQDEILADVLTMLQELADDTVLEDVRGR